MIKQLITCKGILWILWMDEWMKYLSLTLRSQFQSIGCSKRD
jgi:hypothetical protein